MGLVGRVGLVGRGRRLGVDVGTVRVGVAICDPDGILATPLVTLPRETSVAMLRELAAEHEVVEVVVGLPVTLAGTESYAAAHVRDYAAVLAEAVAPLPVILTDERMSTAVASRRLSERGVRRGRHRALVDQAAAVEILQGWLDSLGRRSGA